MVALACVMERHHQNLDRDLLDLVREINLRLIDIEQRLPDSRPTWLAPREMSKLVGVSTRTLQNYVKNGKLSPTSYRRENRGKGYQFRYHRELVLRDLERF